MGGSTGAVLDSWLRIPRGVPRELERSPRWHMRRIYMGTGGLRTLLEEYTACIEASAGGCAVLVDGDH